MVIFKFDFAGSIVYSWKDKSSMNFLVLVYSKLLSFRGFNISIWILLLFLILIDWIYNSMGKVLAIRL